MQTGTQEVPCEHDKKFIYFESDRALKEAKQRWWCLLFWRYSKSIRILSSVIHSREPALLGRLD